MRIGKDRLQVRALTLTEAKRMHYGGNPRRRRRQHRSSARALLNEVGFFASGRQRGTGLNWLARWHLAQARAARRSF